MTGALIILAVTALTGLVLFLTHRRGDSHDGKDWLDEPDEHYSADDDSSASLCCGRHAVCQKGLLTDAADLYYDDEELDRYAGRRGSDYTPGETEEFREVLYTLRPSEVAAWGNALTHRNITIPDSLRDEFIMLCRDNS